MQTQEGEGFTENAQFHGVQDLTPEAAPYEMNHQATLSEPWRARPYKASLLRGLRGRIVERVRVMVLKCPVHMGAQKE